MKKINKKNKPTKNKKPITKNTPAKKNKQQPTRKKVAKAVKKTVAKKTAKKKTTATAKTTPKKAVPKKNVKKKNVVVKSKKLAKPSLVRGKSVAVKAKKKTVKKVLKKAVVKKTVIKKAKTKKIISAKSITRSKPINTKANKIKRTTSKSIVAKNRSVSTSQSLKPQKLHVKPDIIATKPQPVVVAEQSPPTLLPELTNKQFLTTVELDSYRQKLMIIRARLRGDVSTMTDAALNKNRMDASGDLSAVPIHMADVGSDNFEQEQTLSFMQNERGILVDIEDALIRIKDGTYGICEGCGNHIPKVRLNFIPYANMCVKCAALAQNQDEEI